jgi:hypothetical protein
MTNDPLENATGIKAIVLAAGFFGGVASLAHIRGLSAGKALIAVLSGTVCAAFLTPVVQHYCAFPPAVENGVAFLLGIVGMSAVGKVLHYFEATDLEKIVRGAKPRPPEPPTDT